MFDPARALAVVVRSVEDREHAGAPARVVQASRVYPAAPTEVWHALTDPARIPRWFAPVTGELQLGGRYQIEGNAGGTITACEPPHRLALTWEYGGGVSWVEVQLTAEGARTRLTLEHISHKTDEFAQFWSDYGPGATGIGWDLTMLALAEYLATGAPIDRAAGDAWPLTDAGRAFMQASAAGWADGVVAADIDDMATAQAAAGKCVAFYTTPPTV